MNELPVQLVGRSPALQVLDEEITMAARSDAKVLITGESGVGKEVAARLIHIRSQRAQGPLLTLNCAGVPEGLLESELFGHMRGSFTGAVRDKLGLFEQSNGGTVFLDEIGEMSMRMQASLLRFLESGEIQRVGADRMPSRVNVRVICATNRDLADQIAHGAFREDLYYRLNVIHMKIPALRERGEDVPILIDHFLQTFSDRHHVPRPRLDKVANEALLAYEWPGNVRQLKNVIERLIVRAEDGLITIADLPPEVRRLAVAPIDASLAPADALAEYVARELFGRMLERRESFWVVVHDPFTARDLTRETVRRVVRLALEQTGGRHEDLPAILNIPKVDLKRLTAFLRKHDCVMSGEDLKALKPASDPNSSACVA